MQPPVHPFDRLDSCPGRWDECRDGDGLRPHWQGLAAHLGRLGDGGLARRWEQGRRLIRENGLAFQANAGPVAVRPWSLDPVPLVLGADEWDLLAAGVAQRARLLDAVLDDIYGGRRLLAEGVLPPGAVFAHPQHLPACRGLAVAGGTRLHLYACDLVRTPDGAWRVLADHTTAPAGAGFALENRIVLSRTLPEPFKDCRVQRLAAFFQALRGCLNRLAPGRRDQPRVALLSPGPGSESWFEQTYLAQYLGLQVVQGDDLTVRDGRVWLKTLDGLQPVDVLLRRLADEWCDPLELRGDSTLGVLGLVEALRCGGAACANALGSGAAENPALLPFLGEACRRLLGAEPLLEAVPLRWGREALAAVRDGERGLLLRPAGANRGACWRPDQLAGDERRRVLAELEARPHAWVAGPAPAASTAPAWEDGRWVRRSLVLRLFAVRDGEGWAVMPGGLARTFAPDEADGGWLGRGGGAKDVWVLARGEVADISLLPADDAAPELRRGGAAVPSRVADNLFWLGRYAERTEDQARLLRSAVACLAQDEGLGDEATVPAYLALLRRFGQPVDELDAADDARRLLLLAGDPRASGFAGLQQHLRRTAATVRDRLSADTWRGYAALDRELDAADAEPDANQALSRLNRVILACLAIAGMGRENSVRGPAWRFHDLGRRLERATFTAELLLGGLAEAEHAGSRPLLDALLQVCDSGITYRSRYRTRLHPAAVLDLLLADEGNPRSVAFQILQVRKHVDRLPHEGALASPPQRTAMRLGALLGLADPAALATDPAALRALLAQVVAGCGELSDAVTTAYLAHSAPTRTFLRAEGGPRR